MAWESAKTVVSNGTKAGSDTAPAQGDTVQGAAPPLASGSVAELAPPQAAKAGPEPQSGVVLDEANDLLVITQAGTFIGPAARGWAGSLAAEPATLSPRTASWAQEVLAAEAEAEPACLQDPAHGSTTFPDQNGAEDALLHNIDWLDW